MSLRAPRPGDHLTSSYPGAVTTDAARANYADAIEQYSAARAASRRAVLAARTAGDRSTAPMAGGDEFATLAEVGPPADIATLYARLISVASERVQLYGRQLAAAYAESGLDALRNIVHVIDPATGQLEANGEKPTALVEMERRERETLERLIVQGARLNLQQRAADALARNGEVLAGAMRRFADMHGVDWSSPEVRRDAQRAMLEARAEVARVEESA